MDTGTGAQRQDQKTQCSLPRPLSIWDMLSARALLHPMKDVEVGSVGGSTRPAMRLSRSKLSKISHQGVLEEGRLGAQGQGYSFSKTA